ncbi:extensin family protein [Lysobacter arvi]|uniref:Extensin family protein n=1 Tax=Lysobacter arvi TaxID=3038776 RepID=A0ABU1CAY0_9GAMM|nr:extensin family protein [Lysobacter arvi]MDR0181554.1 extensin family protein [Lysobacter arvi]
MSNPNPNRRPSPLARLLRWLPLLALLGLAWALWSGRLRVPEAWNPWAPLRIDAPPNLLTRFKLDRAANDRAACRSALAQADMRLSPVDDRVTGEHCGFTNAVRIERTSVAIGADVTLSCRSALSLAMWERHVLQQAAQANLGARVVRIEHLGSYACRNLYGEQGRRRSQHATADALDVAGFVFDDGRRVRVLKDWRPAPASSASVSSTAASASADAAGSDSTDATPPTPDTGEARFLRAVHEGACDYFDVVLGPQYNQAHADHFHFDRGNHRACR